MRGVWIRVQWAGALTIFAALATTTLSSLSDGAPDFADLYLYFTIQANALAMVTLLASAVSRGQVSLPWFDYLRAAATTYVVLVSATYAVLFASAGVDLPDLWTNVILHSGSAVIMVADWVMDRPRTRLGWRDAWTLTVYPVLYMAAALLRGALDGWVPYPFLDPARGYGNVLTTCLGMIGSCWVIGVGVLELTRWRAEVRVEDSAHTDTPA